MHNNTEKKDLNRGRSAATKWLPMSAIGVSIPFIIGVVMQLPVERVFIASAITGALVFGGLWMQSYGSEKQNKASSV